MSRSRTPPELRKPHEHPSLNCYKNHMCRCDGCRKINKDYSQYLRDKAFGNSVPKLLPPDELARLRRSVGLTE